MALIIEKMHKNIVVEVEKSDDRKVAAFKLSHTATVNPERRAT